MKIESDEEQAALRWLARRGETPDSVGLHAWVAALDAGTRKALGQYLRLRRHRQRAPKVALEITAQVHSALSDYALKEGGVSLGDAIGLLLSRTPAGAGRLDTPAEVTALMEALVAREKDVAELRRRLTRTSPASGARAIRKGPTVLDVAPCCPLCGGAMRLEFANGSRFWVCMTTTPGYCTGTLSMDRDRALSAELIGADWAQAWRYAKVGDAAKAASVVKRTVAALERTVHDHARYWSAGEAASFQDAAAALGKLAKATERTIRKRRGTEKAETERFTQRRSEAQRAIKPRVRANARRDRILVGYALGAHIFCAGVRQMMLDIDRNGLPWGARGSSEEMDAHLSDAMDRDVDDLVWRFASDQRPIPDLIAQWEAEYARLREATRAAAEAFADEVDVWLAQRSVVDAKSKDRGAT